ncbi:dTDP-4-dehydrorhamnose 3,5-epimerase [Gammaproteobacteria bacterium]|nr:dTDP-4-dehydrorhamnose 3,5-epimerase [Gammaproteobacteria bacterium]
MKFIAQSIPEIILIEPDVFADTRGSFSESFRQDLFEKALGYNVNFIQDNESISVNGVLRGLHYQLPPLAQAKLVRVNKGTVLDVAVDIRKSSKSFGQYVAVKLSGENKKQLFIPHGFAHGFVVLSESAIFSYKVDNYYSAELDRGISFDDPFINIDWNISKKELKLSKKDMNNPLLRQTKDLF